MPKKGCDVKPGAFQIMNCQKEEQKKERRGKEKKENIGRLDSVSNWQKGASLEDGYGRQSSEIEAIFIGIFNTVTQAKFISVLWCI